MSIDGSGREAAVGRVAPADQPPGIAAVEEYPTASLIAHLGSVPGATRTLIDAGYEIEVRELLEDLIEVLELDGDALAGPWPREALAGRGTEEGE